MVLDTALLSTHHYKVRVKWYNQGKGVAPSPTLQCSNYWKENLQVANFIVYFMIRNSIILKVSIRSLFFLILSKVVNPTFSNLSL